MAQAPYFFTSYARLDNNKFTKLGEALEELRERVRGILGEADVANVGFFDLEDIQTGQEWVARLGDATARCRVFVCFCSNTYFNREVCGREFEVFRRRLALSNSPAARYVFPVIWDKCVLPAAVARYHAGAKGLPREYLEDGLCCLRRLRREQEYETAIEALARAIAAAAGDPPLPDGQHPINFDALPSVFDNPDADGVRIGVLHDAGLRWSPEIGRTVRAVVEDATAVEKAGWRQFVIDDLLDLKAGDAGSATAPLVLIVPPDLKAIWRARLDGIDGLLAGGGSPTVAVIAGVKRTASRGGEATRAEDDATIRALLPKSGAGIARHAAFDASSGESLRDVLRLVISRLRMDRLAMSEMARVTSPQLEASARVAGVPIDARPTLSGPGAQP